MTLEQILEHGHVVVAADDWMNMIVVWNGHDTFNVWSHVEDDAYRNTDVFTRYNIMTPRMAQVAARKWLANVYDEMERSYGEAA